MDGSKTTGAGVYKWGSKRGHSFRLRLHTTVFQVKIYAIKACIMENIEKGYKDRNNIFSLIVQWPGRSITISR
jgi:hypothetical protein